ncbi:hypothetical protein CHLNCDRAFT_50941 [Chlorella variabilis]|uniref:Uncharacterized protein n=1 Tax=Chlorella variabilis TaxID=554065 RepID=E1Z8X7_CHLVA|nr:hypothetical protein CHLNCDRAFT_50941 [Chlorella variabilis]EFN57681.1 hypothetical protein CHLNCDRAFT_50941 [Chlorella variabilis]|eukprot:XP_005849783.1 hypothetical protein CHLNCDRAFT_50941 [Chlorella variabilis]
MKRAGRLLVLALAALAVVSACAAADSTPVGGPPLLPPPTVVVHLSDIHYSTNVRKYWDLFGNREGDALLWAEQLVPRLGLAGAAITGDITDSKARARLRGCLTSRGEGLQQEAEWLAYAGLLRALAASGLPAGRVWDLPGNHDTFNMPSRGGPKDYFSRYAAEGRRRASPQQRVYVHRLPPPQPPEQQQQQQARGLAGPALMAEAQSALASIRQQQAAACGAPLILAYCHYPLSTVDSSPRHVPGPPGILLHAMRSVRPMQGLTQLLAQHNVSAVLSGHLHSAFGQRLHRVHATPSGGRMAEIETAAWKDDRRFRLVAVDGGALTLLDLMFHTRNSPRMPGRSDAAATQDPGASWQEAYARRGWAVTALEPSAAVVGHLAFITSPPDGRYSPLGAPSASAAAAAAQQANGSQGGWVKALVYALDGWEAAGGGLSVELTGWLPGGAKLFSKTMQPQPAASGGQAQGPLLFAGQGEATVSCVGATGDPAPHCHPPAEHVTIQVSVRDGAGPVSRSPLQPVSLRCSPLTASHQRCWVAAVTGAPLPLPTTVLEWLGLAWNWPVLVHRLFLCVWALQAGGMLLAPRLLGGRVLPLIAASPLLQCRPAQHQLAASPTDAAAAGSWAPTHLLRTCLSHLLWPVAALFLCASVTEVWAPMLAHSLYVLLGPWLLFPALSGHPPAAMFHYGVVGRLGAGPREAARWRFVGTPDTMFVSLVHATLCLLPATAWVACVVARRLALHPYSPPASRSTSSESGGGGAARRRMEAGGVSSSASSLLGAGAAGASCGRWSFSAPQVAALLAIAALNCSTLYLRAASLMGGLSLAASPGFAWTLPLALLLVVAWGVPRRRGGMAPGKGE